LREVINLQTVFWFVINTSSVLLIARLYPFLERTPCIIVDAAIS